MKTIKGDLIELAKQGQFDVIIHGCNCRGIWGAGIAKQLKQIWPDAYNKDQNHWRPLGENRLGTVDYCRPYDWEINYAPVIVNAYTQLNIGKGLQVSYEAIDSCFRIIKERWGNHNVRFGIPAIGAGHGGGNLEIIKDIIDNHMKDEDLTLVLWDK